MVLAKKDLKFNHNPTINNTFWEKSGGACNGFVTNIGYYLSSAFVEPFCGAFSNEVGLQFCHSVQRHSS